MYCVLATSSLICIEITDAVSTDREVFYDVRAVRYAKFFPILTASNVHVYVSGKYQFLFNSSSYVQLLTLL